MKEPNRPYTVYLLHWRHGMQDARHYVGITTRERLAARMREHAGGQGARATGRLAAEGLPFALAKIWYTSRPEFEHEIHQLGACLELFCPVCQGRQPINTYHPTKRAAGNLPPLDHSKLLTALATRTFSDLPPDQKRSGAEATAPLPPKVP